MARTLSAPEAADRLGIKQATLYAYVSRGYLAPERGTDGRRSFFDVSEVERLARRGRPRRTTRGPTIDITIASAVTTIDPVRGPAYRGTPATGLVGRTSFEEVAELLWNGALPAVPPQWPATVPLTDIGTGSLMDRLAVLVAGLGARPLADRDVGANRAGSGGDPSTPGLMAIAGRRLIASVVAGLTPACERLPRLRLAGRSPRRATIAGKLAARLMERRPPVGAAEGVNAALVLLADHELASSTLAARVAASAHAYPPAAVTAGLGACAGPLHGNASVGARSLLDAAIESGPARAIGDELADRGRLAGFGHPLYPLGDPRARVLLESLRTHLGDDRTMGAADDVAERSQQRGEGRPNIDFALAVLTRRLGMAPDAGPAIFAVARMAGWLAHVAEEYGERPLRYRVRAAPRASSASTQAGGRD